ncbi:MAG: hypothetical protein SGJ02_05740 [bacterium]|nr:hypothetical protein [bacterium]
MPITTNASIAQAKSTLLANRLLKPLAYNNVLKQFFKNDSEFLTSTGSYSRGATLSIPIVPTITTNIVTSTGGSVTYPKQTLTSVALTLESIASTPFSINDADITLSNINPENDILAAAGAQHGNSIETVLMLDTFNLTGINGNVVGAAATATNYKLLSTLWKAFFDAKVDKTQTKVVILPSDQYTELLQDTTVSRLANPEASSTLSNGIILSTLNMIILPSNATRVGTDYTNLAALSAISTAVGFAFTTDSIVGAIRELPTAGNGLGVNQTIVRDDTVNMATRLTESYNPNVIGGDKNYHMETLFGTKIYRPTTVFPILGGVA